MAEGWTKALPREEGYYWFWGYLYGAGTYELEAGAKLEQVMLKVVKGAALYALAGTRGDGTRGDWYAYVANGAFLDEPRKAVGLWHKNDPPELPKETLS